MRPPFVIIAADRKTTPA